MRILYYRQKWKRCIPQWDVFVIYLSGPKLNTVSVLAPQFLESTLNNYQHL